MKSIRVLSTIFIFFAFLSARAAQAELSLAGSCDERSRLFANPGPSARLPGRSTASSGGVIAIVLVPVATAVKTLPCGLKLIAESMLPGELYPVAMFVGEHRKLSAHVGPFNFTVASQYNEATFTMAVRGPFSQQPYNYTSKIVVDNIPAQMMGRLLGYPKVLVGIDRDENHFMSTSRSGRSMVEAQFKDDDNYDHVEFERNRAGMMASMNALPTIGKTALGFICFDFKWDAAETSISPVAADLSLSDSFLGLGLGVRLQSASLAKSPIGSFRIQTKWEMSGFRKCH